MPWQIVLVLCPIGPLPRSGHYRMTLDTAHAANCVGHKPGKLNKEVAEFVGAMLEGKPYQIQLTELLDIERQILEVKAALIDDYNESKAAPREVVSLKVAG